MPIPRELMQHHGQPRWIRRGVAERLLDHLPDLPHVLAVRAGAVPLGAGVVELLEFEVAAVGHHHTHPTCAHAMRSWRRSKPAAIR